MAQKKDERKPRWYDRLFNRGTKQPSWLRSITSSALYRMSNVHGNSSLNTIQNIIDAMRSIARDSQVATALAYYATDATITNTNGQIIWAVPKEPQYAEAADIINDLFNRWRVNNYARDHILELATIGNLYIPTTDLYKEQGYSPQRVYVGLDSNTLVNEDYDIVPSTKLPPEEVLHLWYRGTPEGFILQPKEGVSDVTIFPESSIIHFSLGGMLGDYDIETRDKDGTIVNYDIQFATPLMLHALQPTQTLNLLEDAIVLSSLTRVVRIVNVEIGNTSEEEEINDALQSIKSAIEQQLSVNTLTGDTQSFVNPQAPNNLIFVPKVNGQDALTITDLQMSDADNADSKLLEHFQNKKLSVLGVPKEAMNYSSSEGLGGAGQVMSQRSALYANALQRLETAYIEGWTDALNKYFRAKNLSKFVDCFRLKMNPIITLPSTLNFDKRDSALSQAASIVELLQNLGVSNIEDYKQALAEILSEALPQTGADVMGWNVDISGGEGDDNGF